MSDTPIRLSLRRLLPSISLRIAPRIRSSTSLAPVIGLARLLPSGRFPGAVDVSYDPAALRRRHWSDLDRWFGLVLLVVLPTLAASVYYGLVAADRFVSQSEFVLRNPGSLDASGFSSLVAPQAGSALTGGLSIGGDSDAEAIVTYINSPDAMAGAARAVDLRRVFARPEADRIARYPGLLQGDTNHALHRYYEDMISVSYDPTSGVIKLAVEAFRPMDATAISEALLGGAEQLLNRMDLRGREDAIRAAQEQVESARAQVVVAQKRLTEFRLREQTIDPIKMSGVVMETIGQLTFQSIDLKGRLSDLLKNTPRSPQVSVLRSQIVSLDEQIMAQQAKLAGQDDSLSPVLVEYTRLNLQSEFAKRIYTASLEQLEVARVDASRQHAFIERISGPTLPDFSTQPRRVFMIMLVFAVSLSGWLVLRFAIRDSRLHHGR